MVLRPVLYSLTWQYRSEDVTSQWYDRLNGRHGACLKERAIAHPVVATTATNQKTTTARISMSGHRFTGNRVDTLTLV
jgi:hypothetical protein